jgi:hypothetical protein
MGRRECRDQVARWSTIAVAGSSLNCAKSRVASDAYILHHDAVRTTIDLPDSLLRLARRRASTAGTTLSGLVTEALQAFLTTSVRESEAPYEVLTFGTPGARFPTEAEVRDALDAEDADSLNLPKK